MKNKFLKTLLITAHFFLINSITTAQKVINAAGKTDYGNNIIVQYSISEVVVEPNFGKEFNATQGLLQPRYLITGVKSPFDAQFSLRCYPNPISDALNIETDFKDFTDIKVFNEQGQLVLIKSFNYAPINLSELISGSYLLTIYSKEKNIFKTIKIIKQ
jgi:hypothetical protein